MPKFSPTGKPLCCRCRKIATSRQAGHSRVGGVVETFYVYHCSEHAHERDEPLQAATPASQVRRADWVTCKGMTAPVGSVKRLASDGRWADVDWHTHVKRMPTSSLVVQHTIQVGPDTWITDENRQRELEGGQASEDDEILAEVFAHAQQPAHPCPFCPLLLPDEAEQWNPVGNTEYGEPATVGLVRSCEPCARYAEYSESAEALIAALKAKHHQEHDPIDCQCPSCNGDGEVMCEACGVYFFAAKEGHFKAGEYAYCDDCYCE